MPQVHSVGRLFTHRLDYPSTAFPLVDIGDSQETTYPYRCAKPLVFRLPRTRHAVVVGWWGQEISEEEAMIRAVDGSLIGYVPSEEDVDVESEAGPISGWVIGRGSGQEGEEAR